jgi:LPS export ABC transporter protein LptC/lipopolysaccharide transport protein LptA
MKRRRIIWGVAAVLGFLVILLALAGVFAPEGPKEPPPDPAATPTPTMDENRLGVVRDFKTSGANWDLEAPEATLNADESTSLKEPRVSISRRLDDGEQRVAARAAEGRLIRLPQEQMQLSGGVHVDFTGKYNGTLKTPSLVVDPALGAGRTPDPVELTLNTDGGRHLLTGQGVELDQKQRTVKIARNVTASIAVPMLVISAGAEKNAKANQPPIEVTCDGPAAADGFERAVRLQKNVLFRQGADELRADRANLFFAGDKPAAASSIDSATKADLERFEAEGNVRFKTSVVEGSGSRLVRTRSNDQVLLEGAPAVVRQGGSRIEAERIDLDTARTQVDVPMKGALQVVQEGERPERMDITWSRLLHFDPAAHEVTFRGDVRLKRDGMQIDCQALNAKLDENNRTMVACRAEGDVRLSGAVPAAKGAPPEPISARAREMNYDARKESLRLLGDAVALRGPQEARGNDIEFGLKDSSLRVLGPGTLKARAEGPQPAAPIEAAWSGDMQYSREARKAILRRDVAVAYGAQKLKADEATVRLAEDGRATGFDAAGKVEIIEKGRVLRADRLAAALGPDNSLRDATATGQVRLVESGGRTLTADSVKAAAGPEGALRDFDAAGRVLITEPADGKSPPRTLQADRVLVKVGPENALQEFDATGRVVIEDAGGLRNGGRTLRSDRVRSKLGKTGALEGFDALGQVVIEESAPIEKGGRIARAERLSALLGPDNQLRSVTASGRRVTLEEQRIRAVGQTLAWDTASGAGKLTGSPVEVYQGENRLFGDVVEFSRGQGNIRIRAAQRVEATLMGGLPKLPDTKK